VPTPTTAHPSGTTDVVAFGGRATTGGAAPSYDATTGSCSATYCHGNYSGVFNYDSFDGTDYVPKTYAYTGKNATPTWSDGPMACDSCHGNPPAGGNTWHSGFHGGGNQCSLCHPDPSAGGANAATHVNGTVDVTPRWTQSCFACH
jgi:predicted CxxxxCH...CXXCH cytochrome family protein